MRRVFRYVLPTLLVLGLAACGDGFSIDGDTDGNGNIVTQTREVVTFDQITLAGEGTVIVAEGGDSSLTVETDENLLTHIETTVSDGILEIATESGVDIDPTESVVYRATTPHLTGVSLTGAGGFELDECVADAFSVVLSGAGDIEIGKLTADKLDVDITGAGSVAVAGNVTSQKVRIPGAGSYDGRDLASTRATVTNSGVGRATVWVTDELDATVSGVGSIDYYGSPQVTEFVTGIGTVNARGTK